MQLVLISTPDARLSQEQAHLDCLFRAGLANFHIRKPGWKDAQLESYVRGIDTRWHGRCMLHGSAILAARLGLRGVHYTERTRPAPPLRAVNGQAVSTSFHALEQLAQPWGSALSYAFLSPIFDSISKAGHSAAEFDRGQLSTALAAAPIPVMALGGVMADNIKEARRMGFDGVAVIGSVWQADDPPAAFRRLRIACERQ